MGVPAHPNPRETHPPGYFSLIAAGEPFRLLFPLGTVLGLWGVLLWPLYAWNITASYPGTAHPRIMIEGFITCFVVGFLGTALPRLLDVPRMTWGETFGFAVALFGTAWLHCSGQSFWGDQLFFIVILALVAGLAVRILFRKDTPPPGFVLVAMGILSALIGSAIQVVAQVSMNALPDLALPLSRLLLYQGYLLLPIMGIGAFLLPRFFGLPNRQSFPESLAIPPGWIPRALFAFGCGLVVLGSFVLEVRGQFRWGYGLRALAIFVYFFREVPVHQAGFGGGSLALGLRIALFAIPSGYLLMAFWPARASSFIHVVFITGFSLLTFIVASRVVLGHSGQTRFFRASLRSILVLTSLVVVAMLVRVTADWMPTLRMDHYSYAAVTWTLGVLIWAAIILPSVGIPDTEEK
jgi:uncharacterized protein involved in response to NO